MELTDEQAERELQYIVSKLEDESLPFSKAEELYSSGVELVKFCLSSLDETKGKITVIRQNLDEFIEEKFN